MTWKDEEAKLRARWDELTEIWKTTRALADPRRAERDAYVRESDAKIKAMDAEIRAIEAPLFDLENERARIARQLGAKSLRVR